MRLYRKMCCIGDKRGYTVPLVPATAGIPKSLNPYKTARVRSSWPLSGLAQGRLDKCLQSECLQSDGPSVIETHARVQLFSVFRDDRIWGYSRAQIPDRHQLWLQAPKPKLRTGCRNGVLRRETRSDQDT